MGSTVQIGGLNFVMQDYLPSMVHLLKQNLLSKDKKNYYESEQEVDSMLEKFCGQYTVFSN